ERSITLQRHINTAFTINEILNTLWGLTYTSKYYLGLEPAVIYSENKKLLEAFTPSISVNIKDLNPNQKARLTMVCKYMIVTDSVFFNFSIDENFLRDTPALEITNIIKNLCTIRETSPYLDTCLKFIIKKNQTDLLFFDVGILLSITYSLLNKFC